MSRPRKANVDYFPHSTEHGKTMFVLENRWGNDGYAAWFKILEMLGRAENHFIDTRDAETWEYLVANLRITPNTTCEILNTLSNLRAIDSELWESFQVIFSTNFVDGVTPAYRFRKDKIITRDIVLNSVSHVLNHIPHVIPQHKPALDSDSLNIMPTEERRGDMRGEEIITPSLISLEKEIATEPPSADSVNEEIGGGIAFKHMRISDIQELYITYIGRIPHNQPIVTVLQDICRLYPPDRITLAFQAAVTAEKPNLNWVKTYLDNPRNWSGNGRSNQRGAATTGRKTSGVIPPNPPEADWLGGSSFDTGTGV